MKKIKGKEKTRLHVQMYISLFKYLVQSAKLHVDVLLHIHVTIM